MLFDADTLAFVGVAAIVVVTPGPDMALVTTHALGRGRESARLAALGVNAGILVHASAASDRALSAPRYVIVDVHRRQGVRWRVPRLPGRAGTHHRHSRTIVREDDRPPAIHEDRFFTVLARLLVERTEPEGRPALPLAVAAIPGLGRPDLDQDARSLGAVPQMGVAWLLVYAALVSRLAGFFRSTRVRRRLEGLSGAILVALGVRIAVQDA
jgi:hypothetical protein